MSQKRAKQLRRIERRLDKLEKTMDDHTAMWNALGGVDVVTFITGLSQRAELQRVETRQPPRTAWQRIKSVFGRE